LRGKRLVTDITEAGGKEVAKPGKVQRKKGVVAKRDHSEQEFKRESAVLCRGQKRKKEGAIAKGEVEKRNRSRVGYWERGLSHKTRVG